MASVNKTITIGNLGAAPELRTLDSGTSVCNLSVATSRTYTDKNDEKQEETEWHRIVVWGKQAENCAKYLSKGRQVYVEGRLKTRKYEDKEGVTRYSTDIVAERVQFLGGKSDGGGDATSKPKDDGGSF